MVTLGTKAVIFSDRGEAAWQLRCGIFFDGLPVNWIAGGGNDKFPRQGLPSKATGQTAARKNRERGFRQVQAVNGLGQAVCGAFVDRSRA